MTWRTDTPRNHGRYPVVRRYSTSVVIGDWDGKTWRVFGIAQPYGVREWFDLPAPNLPQEPVSLVVEG